MSDQGTGNSRPTAQDIASRLLAFSQIRRKVFEPYGMTVNDIAWQLLLALFVAQERRRRVDIYRLCDDVPVPKTVSVRWLRALRSSGMIDYDDRSAGLSALVRLTPAAEDSLRDLIEA
jgi:phosphatidylserine/phosphatidylglycerophosphate/cardiolipin synthase-like enzyme